jgi:hypothetical protein
MIAIEFFVVLGVTFFIGALSYHFTGAGIWFKDRN